MSEGLEGNEGSLQVWRGVHVRSVGGESIRENIARQCMIRELWLVGWCATISVEKRRRKDGAVRMVSRSTTVATATWIGKPAHGFDKIVLIVVKATACSGC
jgi:hypothetical protein